MLSRYFCTAVLSVSGVAAQGLPTAPAPTPLPPLTLAERARIYTSATVGVGSLLSSAASAGINQWRDASTEWGQGAAGLGRRFGYGLAGNAASNVIEFSVSALRHEDTRYVRSQESGFWRRAGYIIVHTYIVPNERRHSTLAVSRLVGAYGSAFIANTWYPARLTTPGEAILRGTWSAAADMGNSAFLEFWPDIRRKVFHRH
jgi:hypothetical protein